jgi:AraC-like DNA-binding protein
MKKTDPDNATRPVVGLSERYAAGLVRSHSHQRGQLMYAIQGALTVLTDLGSWVLPPHRALWIPPGLTHGLKVGKNAELRTLYFTPKTLQGPAWRSCQVVEVPPLVRELILHVVALRWDYPAQGADARLVRVLLERLSVTEQEPVHLPWPVDQRARRLATHMCDHPTDRRAIPVLASTMGSSARNLERIFAMETGMSIGTWAQQMRLMVALEMLAAGTAVSEAAFLVGYENPSSFIAVFRRSFGTTPTKYFSGDGATEPPRLKVINAI